MSKNVLIISASPRKHGNSDLLCDEFSKGAKASNHEVEKVFLSDKKINYCTACGLCSQNDYTGCAQKDDMEELLEKMISADVIVLSSPVYFYTVNAQMKTFIDRCCAKYTKMINKEFYYIITAAEINKSATNRTIECFRGFLSCLEGAEEKDVLCATGVWDKGEITKTSYLKEAYNLGKMI